MNRCWEPITTKHHGLREKRYLGIYLLGDYHTQHYQTRGENMNLGRYFLRTNHRSWYHYFKGDGIPGVQAAEAKFGSTIVWYAYAGSDTKSGTRDQGWTLSG